MRSNEEVDTNSEPYLQSRVKRRLRGVVARLGSALRLGRENWVGRVCACASPNASASPGPADCGLILSRRKRAEGRARAVIYILVLENAALLLHADVVVVASHPAIFGWPPNRDRRTGAHLPGRMPRKGPAMPSSVGVTCSVTACKRGTSRAKAI